MYNHSSSHGCEGITSQLACSTAQYSIFAGIKPPVRLWKVQTRSRQPQVEPPIPSFLSVRSRMQQSITLTPLVVEESDLDWLAAQPNIQDVQAAELQIRLWKVQTRSRQPQAGKPFPSII
jgi:hypothetical protein